MKLSIIVSTYNRVDALDAVLAGLAAQRGLAAADWEVIVADDGSRQETADQVRSWQSRFPCDLLHVWHEDAGFRLAAIRNRSAAQARGEYLVFMDGDCIPFPDFAREHLRLAQAGCFVAGNRVLLSREFTAQLLAGKDRAAPAFWSPLRWLAARWKEQANRALPWLRLELNGMRLKRAGRWQVLKGCNIGVWRSDYSVVNGFDETFSGWGHEDSGFAVRMIRAGLKLKDGRFAVPVLHLWHQENDRQNQPENWARLEATLQGTAIRALQGVDQYTVVSRPPCARIPPARS